MLDQRMRLAPGLLRKVVNLPALQGLGHGFWGFKR